MTIPDHARTLKYLVSALGQIADSLSDFELHGEAQAIKRVKGEIEQKYPRLRENEFEPPTARGQK